MLAGYLNGLSFRPGDHVVAMVSCERDVEIDVVALIHGDDDPAGPGEKIEPVAAIPVQRARCSVQSTFTGSCVVVPAIDGEHLGGLSLDLAFQPTNPSSGREQGLIGLVSESGERLLAVSISPTAALSVHGGAAGPVAELAMPWRRGSWYGLSVTISDTGRVELSCAQEIERADQGDVRVALSSDAVVSVHESVASVVIAAVECPRNGRRYRPVAPFNGKIERPVLRRRADTSTAATVADWRFEMRMQSAEIVDVSGHERHGLAVNAPTRAVTGSNYTGDQVDFTKVPEQYGAIHFHDDDLDDAGWDETVSIGLPPDTSSGIYAVRVKAPDATDHIPFVVVPSTRTDARVVLLLPTFTYVAYANERMVDRMDFDGDGLTDHPIVIGRHDQLLAEHPEWGASLYDIHSDGSAFVHSTSLRPIPNLRPDYRAWLHNAARHFSQDLYLVDWLTHEGYAFDVITDHDLAARGGALLEDYDIVITGSHPEYVSAGMLDALEVHLRVGGSLMYLGGNGFYWVTSQDPARPHLLELRRGPAGTRPTEGAPGQGMHATTGEPGGLWRHRNRGPNKLTGVGMTAQGWDKKAPGYARMPDSFRPEVQFVFDGIADDEIIGDFGLIMDGAAGDELDRFDVENGSPEETLVIARSTGHSDYYMLAGEDVLATRSGLGGTTCADVRSDMTFLEATGGGAVFSVGSICFTGSLSHNGYDNNVSRLTRNVLGGLLARPGRSLRH